MATKLQIGAIVAVQNGCERILAHIRQVCRQAPPAIISPMPRAARMWPEHRRLWSKSAPARSNSICACRFRSESGRVPQEVPQIRPRSVQRRSISARLNRLWIEFGRVSPNSVPNHSMVKFNRPPTKSFHICSISGQAKSGQIWPIPKNTSTNVGRTGSQRSAARS